MIDTVNSNDNVAEVNIGLSVHMEWNDEILAIMISRYSNIYSIGVVDYNSQVNDRVHGMIK